MTALLELRSVSRSFGTGRHTVRACVDVSLEVAAREVVGLVGESGSGKSTVANLSLGLIPPTSGDVRFRGEPMTGRSRSAMKEVRAAMQAVFQEPFLALDSRRTVAWSIEEPLRIHGRGDRQERSDRVLDLLASVGLGAEVAARRPSQLSGGQLQRVNIARAIALRPALLICDEAVSALDVSVQAQIINLFLDIQANLEIGMLFISHDLAVVRHLSDRIVVMYAGRVVEQGPTDRVCDAPRHPYTRALLEASLEPEPSARAPQTARTLREAIPETGCAFAPRCPLAEPACAVGERLLAEVGDGHASACRRADDMAELDEATRKGSVA